ncbi:MAG: cellulase family glycosylhydrolase [Bacillota bacterium]
MTLRSKKSFFGILMTLSLLISLFSFTTSASAATPMQNYVSAMQPGWNLGNSLDATGDETSWGNPAITQALIQQIAAQGYKSIRIPVTWNHRMGAAPDYTIDPVFMARVQQVVDWSLDAGLYVMINLHHDSWLWLNTMGTNHDEMLAKYNAAWTQIANHFKNHSNKLMFESINEPTFNVDTATQLTLLNEINTSFFNIVRSSGGGNAVRPLVLPTIWTNASQEYLDSLNSTMASLNDTNLIATVHYYGYWPFSVNIAGETQFDDTSITDITSSFDRLYNTFVANGIPVVIGEYGLLGFDSGVGGIEHGEMLKYFEYVTQYAKSKSITHMLWDNGQHFNRSTFQWNDPELYNIIKASLTSRSSTAATDQIFIKQGASVTDASIALNLNGNSFVSLKNGNSTLRSGRDYTLSGSTLTVKASYLSKLTTGGTGEKAVLTAQFSAGANWSIHVLYYNTPVLQNASGTTSGFVIPTAFNGDRLATMEAVYAAGGNAGPQNWTSFKEFSYTFSPSYTNNQITLKQNFFNEVNDGVVNLKFHFWSGAVINYTITKSGTSVVGEAS